MSYRIRSILVLTLAAGLMWHCGGERVTQSQTETNGPPLGKLAAHGHASQAAVVMVHLSRDGAAMSGASVEFSRAIAGRAASYQWSGMTDENGRARVEIAADDVTGYYRARAMQGGSAIGSWSSIPINSGYEVMLNLPIGGKARVTRSTKILVGEIPIGVVIPITGALSSPGLTMKNGLDLAREEINRSGQLTSIQFILEDDGSTVEGAIAAYNKLIDRDGASVIIGPFTSTMSSAAFPIAQEKGVVAISPTSSARGLSAMGDYLFRASLTVDRLIPSGVKTTQAALGYRRVATLYDSDDVFSQSSDAAFKEAFMDNGIEVLTTETVQTGGTDFSAQLMRIKEMNPDAIFISALPTEATGILIQGRQLGIPTAVPFITNLTLTPGEIQRAGDAAEGAIAFAPWSSTADTPGNRAFVENYRAKFGGEPDAFAAQAYTALHILAQAIAAAQSTEASAIRDALAKTMAPTVLGDFSFDAHGDGVYDSSVLIVKNGKFEVFKPSPQVISIGLIPHLTGPFAETDLQNGAELALAEINAAHDGAIFEFIVEDSRSTPEGALAAYHKLIDRDGVSAIIGPRNSSLVEAVFPIAQEKGVVAISPTSAARGLSAIGDYVFRASLTVDRLVPGGVATTQQALGYRRVATIFDSEDAFSRSSDAVLKEAFMVNGVEVLTTETFQTGDADFSAQLTRIKEMNPDAIFVSAQATEMTEVLIQGRRLGIPAEVRFIANLILTPEQIQRAGDAAEGVIVFTAWSSMADTPGNRAFVESYRAKYGKDPNVFAAQSHAATYILTKAIAAASSTDASAIRDALAKTMGLDTVLGEFSFDAHGDGIYDPTILIVENGNLEVFNP